MDISTAEEFELNLKRMNKSVLNILLKDMTMERQTDEGARIQRVALQRYGPRQRTLLDH